MKTKVWWSAPGFLLLTVAWIVASIYAATEHAKAVRLQIKADTPAYVDVIVKPGSCTPKIVSHGNVVVGIYSGNTGFQRQPCYDQ
jgi:hypothetical protein